MRAQLIRGRPTRPTTAHATRGIGARRPTTACSVVQITTAQGETVSGRTCRARKSTDAQPTQTRQQAATTAPTANAMRDGTNPWHRPTRQQGPPVSCVRWIFIARGGQQKLVARPIHGHPWDRTQQPTAHAMPPILATRSRVAQHAMQTSTARAARPKRSARRTRARLLEALRSTTALALPAIRALRSRARFAHQTDSALVEDR